MCYGATVRGGWSVGVVVNGCLLGRRAACEPSGWWTMGGWLCQVNEELFGSVVFLRCKRKKFSVSVLGRVILRNLVRR